MKRFLFGTAMLLISMISSVSCIGILDIGMERPVTPPSLPDYDINKVNFYQNNTWKISPERRFAVMENGRDVYVDPFRIQIPPNDRMTYYMDIISEQELRNNYNGSIFERIKDQAKNLISDDQDGYIDLDKELLHGTNTIEFNRLNSGWWFAYCFGMWNDGKLSGDYQVLQFRINAENPTIEYMNWLGIWEIGDQRNRYKIHIRQDEPNYTFAISGWEGNVPDTENYIILTDFDRKNGDMVFYNQILGNFQDEKKNWYDIMFCGSFYYQPNGQVLDQFTVIGPSTIAKASYPDRKDKTIVNGVISETEIDGHMYPFTFNFMHLKDIPENEDLPILTYNGIVPELPYPMYRVQAYSTEETAAERTQSNHIQKASRHKKAQTTLRKK